jgi:polyphosphate kinase
MKNNYIPRDISWLSFNARVLQEANDQSVTLKDRIRFLGIFSNNLDEFFRVRVATLKRMVELLEKKKSLNIDILDSPQLILDEIQKVVLKQQSEFNRIWGNINRELIKRKIYAANWKEDIQDSNFAYFQKLQELIGQWHDAEVIINTLILKKRLFIKNIEMQKSYSFAIEKLNQSLLSRNKKVVEWLVKIGL